MKRVLSLLVSLGILGLIYLKIPVSHIGPVLAQSEGRWLALSLAMVVPLTCLTAWRLDLLMPGGTRLGFAESNRLILAASVLNLVLPSKMGDVAKAWFMKDRGHLPASRALALVVYEKTWDMLSLLIWCVFGLLWYPQKDWLFWAMTGAVTMGLVAGLAMISSSSLAAGVFQLARRLAPGKLAAKLERVQSGWAEMLALFGPGEFRTWRVATVSVGIWFLHLLQIWLFVLALRGQVPLVANLALAPLAILAGLLPLTMAGIGPRDAALIYFYHPYLSGAAGAALGLLCTMRYVLPALAGAVVVNRYLPGLRAAQANQKPV
jgi:glycosyltransferase 2 family protein